MDSHGFIAEPIPNAPMTTLAQLATANAIAADRLPLGPARTGRQRLVLPALTASAHLALVALLVLGSAVTPLHRAEAPAGTPLEIVSIAALPLQPAATPQAPAWTPPSPSLSPSPSPSPRAAAVPAPRSPAPVLSTQARSEESPTLAARSDPQTAPPALRDTAPPASAPPTPPARLDAATAAPAAGTTAGDAKAAGATPSGEAATPAPTLSIRAVSYLTPPDLQYPPAARRAQEQGRALVRLLVDAAGLPQRAALERSTGHARLDEAALATATATRFRPHTENGVPRAFWVVMPFVFELEN